MSKTVFIENDEWYPVWFITKDYGTEVELSDEEYEKIVKVFDDFEEVQKRLKQLNNQSIKEK